jgi:hypothetical protein
MSVIRSARSALSVTFLASSLCLAAVPGCAALGMNKPSTVAQGKYYSSGEPHYDEFFVSLYLMQVAMADAPRVPETERRALAQALSLPPESDAAAIGQHLREEALKLSRAGVHLRLDQNPAKDKFAMASVTLRSNARPKEDASAALLAQVEQSGTNLVRSVDDLSDGEQTLAKLEPKAVTLDAGVEVAFADTHFGKQGEVKKNLADARQLIALMHARATEVRRASEQLLQELSKALNTDDGSLPPPSSAATSESPGEAEKATDAAKKSVPKAHPKAKPAAGPAAAAPRPKPAAAPAGDAPAAPPKPSKAAPASRDFEP